MDQHGGNVTSDEMVDAALSSRSPSPCDEPDESIMALSQVTLVPANLARPPVQWSVKEVKAWLEFCVSEFSLPKVSVNKFDMNGKALTLLTKQDFIERAPNAGDVLYNVFQLRLQQDGPGYLRSPILLSTPVHAGPHVAEILPRLHHVHNTRSSYIPIRPQISSINSISKSSLHPTTSNIMLAVRDESIPLCPSVPASMLSPAPSEKYLSDTDSTQNDRGQSPHSSDQEMEYVDGLKYEHRHDIKDDLVDHNDDGVCRLLWEFLYQLLQDEKSSDLVSWESKEELIFRILNPNNLADAWGRQKNRSNMTYEKLSRALRYYYKMQIIQKVQGKKLTYRFLQHPATIRRGQRGARPHSSRTLKAKNTETDQISSEAASPSSFISAKKISPSSYTSSSASSSEQNKDDQCTSHLLKNPSDNTSAIQCDVQDQQFFDSSSEIQSNIQKQRLFVYHSAAGSPEPANSAGDMHNMSPQEKNSTNNLKHQLNCCNSPMHYSSSDSDFYCRSQTMDFDDSLRKNNNDRSLVVTDKLQPLYHVHKNRGLDFERTNQTTSLKIEQSANVFSYNNDQITLVDAAHGPMIEKDLVPNPPFSSSSITKLPVRNRSPLTYETNYLTGNRYVTIYPQTLNFHPYSKPLLLNQSTPLSLYPQPQKCSNLPLSDNWSLKTLLKTQDGSYHQSLNHFAAPINAPYGMHHSLKQETCDFTQEEPQDLSFKSSCTKDSSSNITPKCEFRTHESVNKDTQRYSPRSASSDSAYSSDRQEFAKEETHDEILNN